MVENFLNYFGEINEWKINIIFCETMHPTIVYTFLIGLIQ